MGHLIDILDIDTAQIEELILTAEKIRLAPEDYSEKCRHKTLATLFYEPSTRTRLSFEAAMYLLGGNVIGFSDSSVSSASKGESVWDTARIVSGYADIIAMRHPLEGAPFAAGLISFVPVINAGDGGHFHPTQTLTDLYTIKKETGRLTDLTVGICGDLKYGRTVHSLIAALSRYEGNNFILISPEELRIPAYVIDDYMKQGSYIETSQLTENIPKMDILYMTRIQRERFSDSLQYERLKDSYILTPEKLREAKEELRIMHPLPRVNEIDVSVDDDRRAVYFEQTLNGKYIRAALLYKLLCEGGFGKAPADGNEMTSIRCDNMKCITFAEKSLKPLSRKNARGIKVCAYCGGELK
ncbi:MAG: aspartate carbamoyltransferase [Eubacteriaceae bacterium]|nr:aspartate carbamoyltransferase [Eubacteriaceae bacterium]